MVECVGQDREQDRWLSIDILEELAPLRANLTGVVVAPGPYGISPALYFTGINPNPNPNPVRLNPCSSSRIFRWCR